MSDKIERVENQEEIDNGIAAMRGQFDMEYAHLKNSVGCVVEFTFSYGARPVRGILLGLIPRWGKVAVRVFEGDDTVIRYVKLKNVAVTSIYEKQRFDFKQR